MDLEELFNKYEDAPIFDENKNIDLYNMIADINMANACGSLSKEIAYLDSLSYISDASEFSKIGKYYFKPIYYGNKLRELSKDNTWIYSGKCHEITLEILEKFGPTDKNVYAVTSLIRNVNNRYCFHSYIYLALEELVYDYSDNIIMPKRQYDELLVEREINVLNYDKYLTMLKNSSYDDDSSFLLLLHLALEELMKQEVNNYKK